MAMSRHELGEDASRGGERHGLYSAIEGLQRLADLFERRRRQLAAEAGLTDAQWRLLEEIGRKDFMPSLFARRRDCTPAAVSRTLRQLQDQSLVKAAISAEDARQRKFRLTARGRRMLEGLQASRERALDAVWRDLPAGEIERFGRFSARLADRLEAYADGVGGA
jgi:DNA-binding MarR family transcriptional regulator